MDLDEYQKFTESVALYPQDKSLEYLAIGLSGEVGEICELVKRRIRGDENQPSDEDIANEIGDAAFYLSELARGVGFSLSRVFTMNRDKLEDRKRRGVLLGRGDNR